MATTPVTLDFSKAIPIGGEQPPPVDQQASALQSAVAYGAAQDPDKYAHLLDLQKRIGIPPAVSAGNEQQVRQAADVNSIDYPKFAAANPRTTAWASKPENAAVSGVSEVERLGGIEQNAAAMRAVPPTDRASSPFSDFKNAFLDGLSDFKDALAHPLETLMGADTPAAAAAKQASVARTAAETGDPFLGSVAAVQAAAQKPLLSVSNRAWFQGALDPKSQNVFSRAITGGVKAIEALSTPDNLSLFASLPFAPEDASALISGVFSAQMAEGAAAGGYQTIRAAYNGNYGDAAEAGAGALIGAAFAAGSGKHALTDRLEAALAPAQPAADTPAAGPYLSNLADAVTAAGESKLRERAPDKFYEAQQALYAGDASLRIPSDQFSAYFQSKGVDPAAVAKGLGSTNYAEAALSGGDVEIAPADFLAKLDPEHQKALLGDIVDPGTGLTARQHQEGLQELQQWATGGGAAKLAADTAAADAETAATPEYQEVKEQLRQRYVDAGETPEVAETLAAKDANVYSNLARGAGMKPADLLNLYNPKVTLGEAPVATQPLYQDAIDNIRSVVEAAKDEGAASSQKAVIAPVHPWMVEAARNNGLDIEGYSHVIDGSAVRHVINRHGDAAVEASRGQLPVSEADFDRIPEILDSPDQMVLGTKTKGHKDQIGYMKRLEDGTTLYLEEARTGKKELATVSMRKYPATKDFGDIAGTLPSNARGDGGNKPIIVQPPARSNEIDPEVLHQEPISADRAGRRYDSPASATDSPEFARWFGESKATDENGKPATVYHGTALDFDAFDPLKTGSRTHSDTGDFGSAAYFADEPGTAEKYAANSALGQPYEYKGPEKTRGELLQIADGREGNAALQMSARDVARWMLDDKSFAEAMKISGSPALAEHLGGQMEKSGAERRQSVMPAFLRAENPLVLEAAKDFHKLYDLAGGEEQWHSLTPEEKAAAIQKAGYDSVHDKSYGQWAVFDPTQVKSAIGNSGAFDPHDPNILHQAAQDGPRGWFRVSPDGRSFEMGKTRFGDLSTFVHEPAHAYLKILGDLVKQGLAGSALTRDYHTVLDWLGAKDGEPLTREQQETWARANEQYLREGKPPSPGLKGAFQRFAIWLGAVYKKASDLGVTLSDDIRGVFDRMYAAEDGVNKAEREAGPKLFSSPEEAGWTREQFDQYAQANNITAEQAKSDLLGRLNEAAVLARSEAWRHEEQNVRTAVTAEVDQRPEYSAIRSLRRGALDDGTEITLSRDELAKQFGEERVKQLQQAHPGLYRNGGGEEPEIVAEVFGYQSAADMMKALELAPRRSAAIEAATRDYMTAKHGDIRYDGTLDDQARIALENDKRADLLHRELTALKQKVQQTSGREQAMRSIEVAPIASYREAARQMAETKRVADLNPTRYLDASRKYSREAFDALRAGDAQSAANAKHKELMNHFLFREATNAKEYVAKFEAYAKRVQKPPAQAQLGLAGADYRDQFNRILGRYGLAPMPGPAERTLAEWAASEYDKGKEPAIEPAIMNESRTVNYRNAPVAEIRQVHDALINVRKLAQLELGISVNGKRIEFSSAIANMDAQAHEALPAKKTRVLQRNATLGEKIADYAQRGDALLMRTERLVEWLDGGKTGPWHDHLWNLAADAQGNEYKLQEQVTKQLGDALENMPKEQRAKMLDKVTVDGIDETLTRHDLVSMAMNMGNDGNQDRLEKTFDAHGWDRGAIERIKGMLTAREWQFVQDSWDSLKPLGVAQAELERRLTGLPPVMVRPTPLDFKSIDGEEMHLNGGYYPVVMDPRFSARGADQDAGATAQNLMEAGYGRAATSRGNMKERTGFGGPLQLDYEQVLTQHTAKVIKDITHREFMLAANKLLRATQIRQTLRETLGAGYEEKMMPWLRTIINDRNGSAVQGLGDFSRLMRSLRTNLTLATLSYKISTSLLQWTHAPRMLLSTNPGSYAQAIADFLAHPQDVTEQVRGLSPNEMAGRGENLDRDIRAVLRGDPGIKRSVARVGNFSIKYTDHILSFPLWLSVYRDALKEHVGLDEDRAQYLAVHAADSAVRLGLGSAAPKDLPPIMRNNDLSKLVTMYYSFHNGIYGQVRDIGHQFRQNGGIGKLSYGLALSVLVPAVLGGMVTANGPKDGENAGLWAAKRALLFGADTVPLLRDAASAYDSDGEVKNPLFNVGSKAVKATMEATGDSDDKDWNGIGLSYLEVGGDLAGVPGTTQAMKPFRYMNQAQRGNVENPNVWDAVAGSGRR